VLHLLALEYMNRETAQKLFISVRTGRHATGAQMRKLDLWTRAELVLYALSNGLIGPN